MKRPKLKPRINPGAAVKIIGLGGVGSIVARYVACFLSSFRTNARLVLIDGDKFEPGNASRMIFGACGNKAKVVRKELLPRFRQSKLVVAAVPVFVKPDNLKQLIQSGDTVFLCVDNHATRKLVGDYCTTLKNVCLLSGGNDGVDRKHRGTYGNVQLYQRKNGHDKSFRLDHFHPEIKQPKDKLPTDLSCTELVVSVPQILFANLATASALCNTFLLCVSGRAHYGELCFDIAEGVMRPTSIIKY